MTQEGQQSKKDYATMKTTILSNTICTIFCGILIIILGFMAVVVIAVGIEKISGGDNGWADWCAFIFLFSIFAVPLYKVLEWTILGRKAKYMNQMLVAVSDGIIAWERLEIITGKKNSGQMIRRLVRKKYLTGITINNEKKAIILDKILEQEQQEIKKIRYEIRNCPNCGAQVKAVDGALAFCDYCGSGIDDDFAV